MLTPYLTRAVNLRCVALLCLAAALLGAFAKLVAYAHRGNAQWQRAGHRLSDAAGELRLAISLRASY